MVDFVRNESLIQWVPIPKLPVTRTYQAQHLIVVDFVQRWFPAELFLAFAADPVTGPWPKPSGAVVWVRKTTLR